MSINDLFGFVSVALAAASLVPYLHSVMKGRTKPHVFSWAIWSLLTAIAFCVQWSEGAGPGAWATAFSAVMCLFILAVSFRYGEKHITRSDWITFISGLLAIPLWLATDNPALAAIWVTVIDALGFYPTFRKSWHKPHEEMVTAHALSVVKHFLSILALAAYSIPTAFYPVALVIMNVLLVGMIVARRLSLKVD